MKKFIKQNQNLNQQQVIKEQVEKIESHIKNSKSKFEWIDSVLVRSIVEGDWVVFENANLCNASILDRLNPLLEEGN